MKKYNILKKTKITLQDNLKLTDIVIVYNNGFKWRIIPFNIALNYPIIYDKINGITVSIFTCPNTYYSCIFEGKFTISEFIYENVLVLQKKNKLFKINEIPNKFMSSIKTYKNALVENPDFELITPDISSNISILDNTKQINLNNKDFSRIIEYYSSKNLNKKYTVIKTGYNTDKFNKYLELYGDDLREKNSFISSILFSQLIKNSTLFPDFKIIKI